MKKHGADMYKVFVRMLCVLFVYLCILSVSLPIIILMAGDKSAILIIGGAQFMFIGYLLQYAFSLIFNFKRKTASKAYESDVKHFSFAQAFIPMLLCAVIVFFYSWAADSVSKEINDYYLNNALKGLSMLGGISAICGCILWFFPTERIVSQKSVIVGSFMIFIPYIVCAVSRFNILYYIIILLLYAFCTAVIFQYNNMTRNYCGSVMSFVNKKNRRMGIRTSFVFLLASLPIFLAIATLFSGILVIFKSLLYSFLHMSVESDDVIVDKEAEDKMFNTFVFGNERAQSSLVFYFFVIFLICALILVLYIALRKNRDVKELWARLKKAVIEFLRELFYGFKKGNRYPEYSENESYVDVERKIMDSGGVFDESIHVPSTYADFYSRLCDMQNDRERVVFCYVTMTHVGKNKISRMKDSDTPREIAQKLMRYMGYQDMDSVAYAYEIVEYSNMEIDHDLAENAIERMVDIIRLSIEH